MSESRPFAFVLMPFDRCFDDIYKLGIKEAAERTGILAERVDEQLYKEGMLDRIYNQISAADFIIADMTGRNSNVFYEVGFAHAKEKLCILLTSDADDIPFDLKHRRHIVYGKSISRLKEDLNTELAWAVKEVAKIREKKIQVELRRCAGLLTRDRYFARGSVDFHIDLKNNSDQTSPDIEMAYFYCGKGWDLSQEGKACPKSPSDHPEFAEQHFIHVPVPRLRPKGWAQLRFQAKKILGTAVGGEELKDTYHVAGHALLRLVTAKGDADYDLHVDVIVDEIPF